MAKYTASTNWIIDNRFPHFDYVKGAKSYIRTKTKFTAEYKDGHKVEIAGNDFKYGADGLPVGGGNSTDYVSSVRVTQKGKSGALFLSELTAIKLSDFAKVEKTASLADDKALLAKIFKGDDLFTGGGGKDFILGYDGKDEIHGNGGGDYLDGGNGRDTLYGEGGFDALRGGAGADTLHGGIGNDWLNGQDGYDVLYGGNGDDTLIGEAGKDTLWGGNGSDRLTGGAGADRLNGGAGADTFVFTALADSTVAASGQDRILDFKHAEGDKIDLRAIDANSKVAGDQAFHVAGSAAFDGTAGALIFETDGFGNTTVSGDVNGDRVADFAFGLVFDSIGDWDFLL